ncbi:PREDICTED: uncharacterized protein LOC106906780 isoform X2 [Poecilia mexicana]|uniref:uncharacterized protein LOC106906780 isoform X2 n=1 Tax=Poecilia mexicana TaxID=48701 RepID=UPI00072E236F|nr:PREDICTED: uncharacterized protein LOC106906780 isoform X2 [Poecilia mexicana]
MRKLRKNRRDLGLLRSESEDDPRGFENISNGVPGTPRSFTIESYTEAVSKEGLTSSDEEDDIRVVKLPIQSEAPEKLLPIQDTNRLNNISSEDEATSIRREVADGSQGIDMSTFRSVNQTLAYLMKAFSRSAGSLHRDVSSEYSHQSIHQQLQSVANCVTSQSEQSNGPRGRETLMSSPRYANTVPRRSDPSSPRSRHSCVKDEILDGYNYRSSSGSRSRHRDEASRSRSRHYDAASGHREYSSRSRHRDEVSRSRSRHRDGPSRSRSRHRDEVSRSRSRHSAEASRSENRGWTFPLPQDVFQRELFNILFDIRNRLTSEQPIPAVVHIDKMETMEDFVREEERLSDPKVFETFVLHVSRIGGKNTKDFVNKVLDRLFTNALMAKFNMKGKGKRGKKPLENTMVYKAIKDGIMTGDWAATEDFVRLYAAEHLKHAPHRSGGRGRQLTED